MHNSTLPALPVGSGGAPPLLSPVIREEKVEVSGGKRRHLDMGGAIQRAQAALGLDESVCLKFTDPNGSWCGGVTLTRIEDGPGGVARFEAHGAIFAGGSDDRGVSLSFIGEPDGPLGLPIRTYDSKGRPNGTYTDDDENQASDATIRAAFFASGTSFTMANAPKVKGVMPNASTRAAKRLAEAAAVAETEFLDTKQRVGLRWFTAKDLLKSDAQEGTWPRPMPKPVPKTGDAKSVHQLIRENPETTTNGHGRFGVHKRAKGGAIRAA